MPGILDYITLAGSDKLLKTMFACIMVVLIPGIYILLCMFTILLLDEQDSHSIMSVCCIRNIHLDYSL